MDARGITIIMMTIIIILLCESSRRLLVAQSCLCVISHGTNKFCSLSNRFLLIIFRYCFSWQVGRRRLRSSCKNGKAHRKRENARKTVVFIRPCCSTARVTTASRFPTAVETENKNSTDFKKVYVDDMRRVKNNLFFMQLQTRVFVL